MSNKKFNPLLWQLFCLGISILIFSLILLNRSPFMLRPISMALRTGFGVIVPVVALVMYLAFRIPSKWGHLIALTSTMSLFALGLSGLWASGNTQSVILSGLIPLTDAAGYYTDATRLLYGIDISNFTAMRPFFAGLLSFFLWLSNQNLMISVSIFTAIAGLSCYLACREIKETHGAELATFVLMLMFLYYRHHSGTTMSESLGVSVSLLGVALLWRGLAAKKEWQTLFSIGMLALALNIRPGAMFVLPALLLWGSWVFRGSQKFSLRFLGLGVVIILAAFYTNSRLIDYVAGSSGVPFENFAWAFYGLASGGKSWTYVFESNPQLKLLPENEVTPTIYRLAFELILSNPLLLIKGALFYWKMFFSNSWYNAYAFVAGDNYWVGEAARWGMYLLNGLGIYKWFKARQDPYTSLAVITALGVLASVPFVPPTDAYRVRLYAATIPFFALLPGMGLFFLKEKFISSSLKTDIELPTSGKYLTPVFSSVLIFTLILAPILLKTNGKLPSAPTAVCPPGMDSFFTRFNAGSSVNIHRENRVFIDWMPDFHASLFRRNAHSLPDINLIAIFETISPLNSIFYGMNLQTGEAAIVVAGTDLLPEPGTLVQLCGELSFDPAVTPYTFFFAEEIRPVQGQ